MDLIARRAQLEQQKNRAIASIRDAQMYVYHAEGAIALIDEQLAEEAAKQADAQAEEVKQE